VSQEGDALFQHVARFVRGRVPPEQEMLVIELVARSIALVMTTPEFLNNLTVVQELRQDNWNLRQALVAYQRDEMARMNRSRRAAAARAAKGAPKKAAAKKAPAPRKAAPRKSPNAAFKRGAADR